MKRNCGRNFKDNITEFAWRNLAKKNLIKDSRPLGQFEPETSGITERSAKRPVPRIKDLPISINHQTWAKLNILYVTYIFRR
jgi:hypothetical protein